MLKVYTSQYKYDGENRLDITVKTGLQMFAPTWDMVNGVKREESYSHEKYTKEYYEKMRTSYKTHRLEWDWLLKQDRVVLVCFCKAGDFCHRLLLADILVKLGAKYIGEIP
jgi:uncharacterized protein YeaO (DUF488 family)